jgi:hypothetical protein
MCESSFEITIPFKQDEYSLKIIYLETHERKREKQIPED